MDFREIKILQASLQEGRVIYKEKNIDCYQNLWKLYFMSEDSVVTQKRQGKSTIAYLAKLMLKLNDSLHNTDMMLLACIMSLNIS